jgi:hypothetical protein
MDHKQASTYKPYDTSAPSSIEPASDSTLRVALADMLMHARDEWARHAALESGADAVDRPR